MLLYGGIALMLAGIVTLLFSRQLVKDPQKRADRKKKAPWLIVVGAAFLLVRFLIA